MSVEAWTDTNSNANGDTKTSIASKLLKRRDDARQEHET